MAPDPPAMNNPGDVLTSRRFVFDWLGFYFFVLRLCTEDKCTFGQVHHGEQSLQPSHHGDNALRPHSLQWCPPLKTRTRTDSHFFLSFRNAPITLRILLICDSYPLSLCLCIYYTFFLTLHIFYIFSYSTFFLTLASFGFDMLFVLYVLLFALREAFKL
jgi:hypothetical protein